VSLLETILSNHLYYEDVQQLAHDHQLPTSRRMDELVGELVASGELDPEEVVRFLRVDDLRDICEELGLKSGATRDVLAMRVAEELRSELEPPKGRPKPRRKAEPEPSGEARPAYVLWPVPSLSGHEAARGPTPATTVVHVHHTSPSSVAWAFAAILVGIVFGGVLAITEGALVVNAGALTAVVVGVLVAVGLLLTNRKWTPGVDRLAHRPPP
jgi:hypothetical protein